MSNILLKVNKARTKEYILKKKSNDFEKYLLDSNFKINDLFSIDEILNFCFKSLTESQYNYCINIINNLNIILKYYSISGDIESFYGDNNNSSYNILIKNIFFLLKQKFNISYKKSFLIFDIYNEWCGGQYNESEEIENFKRLVYHMNNVNDINNGLFTQVYYKIITHIKTTKINKIIEESLLSFYKVTEINNYNIENNAKIYEIVLSVISNKREGYESIAIYNILNGIDLEDNNSKSIIKWFNNNLEFIDFNAYHDIFFSINKKYGIIFPGLNNKILLYDLNIEDNLEDSKYIPDRI